jgi:hypothetical protein
MKWSSFLLAAIRPLTTSTDSIDPDRIAASLDKARVEGRPEALAMRFSETMVWRSNMDEQSFTIEGAIAGL